MPNFIVPDDTLHTSSNRFLNAVRWLRPVLNHTIRFCGMQAQPVSQAPEQFETCTRPRQRRRPIMIKPCAALYKGAVRDEMCRANILEAVTGGLGGKERFAHGLMDAEKANSSHGQQLGKKPEEIHVLLVDDENLSRVVVGNLLRKCNYQGAE